MVSFPATHLRHLEAALSEALESVPFYARWKAADPGPSHSALERLRRLPTLTRRELRTRFPAAFVPEGKDVKAALEAGEVEIVATSGTTDDRVQVLWWQPWWDRQEEAQYRLGHPISGAIWGQGFKEAVLTTPVCSSGVCHVGDLPMEQRIHQRMLFLNQKNAPLHWSERDLSRMVDELARYQPEALEADPAYLAALCRYATHEGIRLHAPRYIGLTYEFISRAHLKAIRRAYPKVTLLDSYGSTEAGCLHMSCERGRLHPNLEWTHTDLVPLRPDHGGPQIGRLVATVLQNPWLKLLRYETGDLARLAGDACPCGRAGESLLSIEGRIKDATFRTDGTLVTVEQVDAAVGGIDGLEAYQVIQEARGRYFARYVPEPGSDEAVARALAARLGEVYGGGELQAQRERAIAPEPSGKYRLARCEVPFDPAALFPEPPWT